MKLLPSVLKCVQVNDKLKNVKVVASSLLCLGIYASELKTPLTSQIPVIMPMLGKLFPSINDGDEDSVNSLITSIISCVMSFVNSYTNLLQPYISAYLPKLLSFEYTSNKIIYGPIMELMTIIAKSLEFRLILNIIMTNFNTKELQNDTSLAVLFRCLRNSLLEPDTTLKNTSSKLYGFLFDSLKIIPSLQNPLNMTHCIDEYVEVFNALVLKLSDDTFKPFFLKCSNGFTEVVKDKNIESIYIYSRIFISLSKTLKSLFIQYYDFILQTILNVLAQLPLLLATSLIPQKKSLTRRSVETDVDQRNLILECIYMNIELLQTLFQNDNANFVDSQKIEMLLPIVNLLDSMHNCYKDNDDYFDLVTKRLSPCICQFSVCVPNQVCWKPLNHQLLIQTQHTDSIVRLASLQCLIQLWNNLAENVMYLIQETLPYLTDLMEDSNQDVVEASREFAGVIQKYLGADSLNKYLN